MPSHAIDMQSESECSLPLHLRQDAISDLKCLPSSRHSAIRPEAPIRHTSSARSRRQYSRSLQQDFTNLDLGSTVAHGTRDVNRQLVPFAERSQHAQVDERACLELESWACPDATPGVLLRHALANDLTGIAAAAAD